MGLFSNFLYTEKAAQAAPAGRSEFVNQMAQWFGGGNRRAGLMGLSPVWTGTQNLSFIQASNKGYKAIVWVRACVDLWGKSLGAADWKVYKRGTDTPIPGHELELLMRRPNPFQDKSEFFQTFAGNMALAGNDYWEKVVVTNRGTGSGKLKVKQLWHMRPDWVAPVPDPVNFISGYLLNSPVAQNVDIDARRLIHFKYYDPLNPYVGISPISSAYRSLFAEEGAAEWNQGLLDNYAQPSGILSTDSTIVPDDRDRLKDEVDQAYTGGNRFSPMVLWGGLKWQQIALTHTDIQFLQQKIVNKEELCAILNTPAVLVGAVADPSYSNAGAARLSFWEDRVDPMLGWIAAKLDMEIVQPYYGEDIELRYDISNVPAFRKALAEKTNTAKTLVSMGFPLNDVNSKLHLGMAPVPWGDVAWMPTSVMPVDEDNVDRLLGEDPADAANGPAGSPPVKKGATNPDDPKGNDPTGDDDGVSDDEL